MVNQLQMIYNTLNLKIERGGEFGKTRNHTVAR